MAESRTDIQKVFGLGDEPYMVMDRENAILNLRIQYELHKNGLVPATPQRLMETDVPGRGPWVRLTEPFRFTNSNYAGKIGCIEGVASRLLEQAGLEPVLVIEEALGVRDPQISKRVSSIVGQAITAYDDRRARIENKSVSRS